jgi:adenylylsulfate kinase-like enzyme
MVAVIPLMLSGAPSVRVMRRRQLAGGATECVPHQVDGVLRRQRYGQEGAVIWLTGLPGARKSTLVMDLEACLLTLGYACYTLDGESVHHGLHFAVPK